MIAELVSVTHECWPIDGAFTISRGAKTVADVVVVSLATTRSDGTTILGRGECVPYARYGESIDAVIASIHAAAASGALDRAKLPHLLPAGAARNALDCALLDLEARRSDQCVAGLLGLTPTSTPGLTCYTLSLGSAATMAAVAARATDKPLLKLKLGGGLEDAERLRQVRSARPDARLVADANEAWTPADLPTLLGVAAEIGLELVEQPLPAGQDQALAKVPHLVPVCADESAHTSADIPALVGLYDAVNIKLDKAGGLTEALAMARAAEAAGLTIMVGCMVATSLSMAPAWLLAGHANWLDLDGPLLLARDRTPSITYRNGVMQPPPTGLWGCGTPVSDQT